MIKVQRNNSMKSAESVREPKHIGGKWDMRIAKFGDSLIKNSICGRPLCGGEKSSPTHTHVKS